MGYQVVAPFKRGYAQTGMPANHAYGAICLGMDVLELIALAIPHPAALSPSPRALWNARHCTGYFLHREAPDRVFEHIAAFLA